MQYHDDGHAHFTVQAANQFQNLHLVADIQIGGGFVENEDFRLLADGHGNPCALTFAAGECAKRPMLERSQPGQAQRLVDDAPVLRRQVMT